MNPVLNQTWQTYFATQSSAQGFDQTVEFKVGSKTFNKHYKVVNTEAKPLKHWQVQRGCLYHHGVLPVVESAKEAKQLASALFPGKKKIPLGFEFDQTKEKVYWLDGFKADKECYNIQEDLKFGVYNGIVNSSILQLVYVADLL